MTRRKTFFPTLLWFDWAAFFCVCLEWIPPLKQILLPTMLATKTREGTLFHNSMSQCTMCSEILMEHNFFCRLCIATVMLIQWNLDQCNLNRCNLFLSQCKDSHCPVFHFYKMQKFIWLQTFFYCNFSHGTKAMHLSRFHCTKNCC